MKRIELTIDYDTEITMQSIKNICDYLLIYYQPLPAADRTELIKLNGARASHNLLELFGSIIKKEVQRAYDMGVADGLNNRIKEQGK